VSKVKTLQEAIKQASVLEECFGREGNGNESRRVNCDYSISNKTIEKGSQPVKF